MRGTDVVISNKKNVFPFFTTHYARKKREKRNFFFAKCVILSIFQNLLNFEKAILRKSRSRFDHLFSNLITPLKQLM